MYLHHFIDYMLQEIHKFDFYWEKNGESDIKNFPQQLESIDEWLEQFITYLGTDESRRRAKPTSGARK